MNGSAVAGALLLLAAAGGGLFAYQKGMFSSGTAVGQLSSRRQALVWMGEQLSYKGERRDVHDFVDGGTGLSTTLERHFAAALSRKDLENRPRLETVNSQGIGRPW